MAEATKEAVCQADRIPVIIVSKKIGISCQQQQKINLILPKHVTSVQTYSAIKSAALKFHFTLILFLLQRLRGESRDSAHNVCVIGLVESCLTFSLLHRCA